MTKTGFQALIEMMGNEKAVFRPVKWSDHRFRVRQGRLEGSQDYGQSWHDMKDLSVGDLYGTFIRVDADSEPVKCETLVGRWNFTAELLEGCVDVGQMDTAATLRRCASELQEVIEAAKKCP